MRAEQWRPLRKGRKENARGGTGALLPDGGGALAVVERVRVGEGADHDEGEERAEGDLHGRRDSGRGDLKADACADTPTVCKM